MIKKKCFLAILFCLLVTANHMSADNYFTLSTDSAAFTVVNDTLRLHPSNADNYLRVYVVAQADGYFDHWYLEMTHHLDMDIYYSPFDFNYYSLKEGPAMNVPYINYEGIDSVYQAVLLTRILNQNEGTDSLKSYFSSTINKLGYWDPFNNGNYQSYGTIKWGPGSHFYMMTFRIHIRNNETEMELSLDATMSSIADSRDIELLDVVGAHKTIHIIVAYSKGDVNGDGQVTIADITQLIDWMSNGFQGANVYQQAACDVNGDGHVSLADVTYLADYIMELNGSNE